MSYGFGRFLPALLVCLLLGCTSAPSAPAAAPTQAAKPTAAAANPADTAAAVGSPSPVAAVSKPPRPVSGEVTVFAAASLADAFRELGEQFRAAHPNSRVAFNFGASSQLRTQLEQGATADVFASADQVQMDRAREAGLIAGPDITFVTNRLVLITPAANPGGLQGVGDLARSGLRVVTAQPEVPIGVYTQAMLDRMSADPQFGSDFKDRVNANIVSREANVRQVVAKVQLGEADASVVYVSDVTPQAATDVAQFEVPDAFNTIATYPIALVSGGPQPEAGCGFIAFVLSPAGQAVLAQWGFIPVGATAAGPRSKAALARYSLGAGARGAG